MKLRVVKLGGSVLGERGRHYSFDEGRVRRLGRELATASSPLVVVHGAGTYGRAFFPLLREHGGVAGDQLHLARCLQGQLRELQLRIESALLTEGLPVVALDTPSLFAIAGDELTLACLDPLRHHLGRGRVPLLSGTLVWDEGGLWRVLSSDRITAEVARTLAAERVLWVTDVDGVYAGEGAERRVLRHLDGETLGRWRQSASDREDPTGGMLGKLRDALGLAEAGIPSIVLNGLVDGRLESALAGETAAGTLIG